MLAATRPSPLCLDAAPPSDLVSAPLLCEACRDGICVCCPGHDDAGRACACAHEETVDLRPGAVGPLRPDEQHLLVPFLRGHDSPAALVLREELGRLRPLAERVVHAYRHEPVARFFEALRDLAEHVEGEGAQDRNGGEEA
jgi:hypothetical protein